MCGIIGQININATIDTETFNRMRDTMTHRGPDGAGTEIMEGGRVALGHRRLSIIDLSDNGKQPMCNEDGSIWLTFNGEIYNYKELKQHLQSKGHHFKSHTDSEVIIHGYEEWGRNVVDKLNGMFAFGIWDANNKQLLLARDRFGIKPLYYYLSNNSIIFASEIKGIIADTSISRDIDHSSLFDFFAYMYIPAPKSIWKNIYKLLPAHTLEFRCDNPTPRLNRYWQLHCSDNEPDLDKAAESVHALMLQSIKEHLESDVPVGVSLSGGMDSSSIVHYMHLNGYTPQTFTIGFKNFDQSEHDYARLIADQYNTIHKELILKNQCLDISEELSFYFDEPCAISSMIPFYYLSKLASQHCKVIHSGEGGDEIFAGYKWHNRIYDRVNSNFFSKFLYYAFNNRFTDDYVVKYYYNLMGWLNYSGKSIKELFNPEMQQHFPNNETWLYKKYFNKNLSIIKSIQKIEFETFLPEACLMRTDRCSMAHSLEVRVPFLDHNLAEYILSLKENIYYNRNIKKSLLLKNISKHFPDEVLNKPKKGFSLPINTFIDTVQARELLLDGRLIKSDIFDKNRLLSLYNLDNPLILWGLSMLELWYQRWKSP